MDGIEETLELVLEPPLRFEPTQVLVNRSGLYAALLGAGGELVVDASLSVILLLA